MYGRAHAGTSRFFLNSSAWKFHMLLAVLKIAQYKILKLLKSTRRRRSGSCNTNLKVTLNYTIFLLLLSLSPQFSCLINHIALFPAFLWYLLPFKNVGCSNLCLFFWCLLYLRQQIFGQRQDSKGNKNMIPPKSSSETLIIRK